MVNNLPAVKEMQETGLGWEDPLEEEMATHSSILSWETPRTEEPGSLQPKARGHKESDSATQLSTHTDNEDCFLSSLCPPHLGFMPVVLTLRLYLGSMAFYFILRVNHQD